MKRHSTIRSTRGFALVLTLSLLTLLVLAVVALSSLVRVSGQISTSSGYQMQARQNALLGLSIGLSDLQRLAGNDSAVTAMAGITGIAPGAANSMRHWCGAWRSDGSFSGWLASGAQSVASPAIVTGVATVELIGNNTVGAPASNSEHAIVGKIPIPVTDAPPGLGSAGVIGSYAYLVSDEGVKTSVLVVDTPPVTAPVVFSTSSGTAQGKLRDALTSYSANLRNTATYEQLKLLPSPTSLLTPSVLQDNFHHATLTTRFVIGGGLQSGYFNVNTSSVYAWRNLFQTYNQISGIPAAISSANVSSKGTTAQNTVSAFTTGGKLGNGPFSSVAAVGSFLTSLFPASGSPTGAQIYAMLAPMLTVRSDTFRIRGYGESVNPLDSTKIESKAYCEAIVQRTAATAPNGLGRRFVITYFRWLGPDDI